MSGRRVFVRPLPARLRRRAAGVVLATMLVLGVVNELAGQPLARWLPSALGTDWAPSPLAVRATVLGVLLIGWVAGLGLLGGVLGRRYGACELTTDALEFTAGGGWRREAWRVERVDVTGWSVTPHGVLVQAARRVRLRDGAVTSRAGLRPLTDPLLVPTRDAAETEEVVAWLSGREASTSGDGPVTGP